MTARRTRASSSQQARAIAWAFACAGLAVLGAAGPAAGAEPAAPRFALEHERSTLDGGAPDWAVLRLRGSALWPESTGWFAVARESRFGLDDTTLAFGASWRLAGSTRLEWDLGGAPSCAVAACATGRAGIAVDPLEGLTLRAGLRRTDYDDDAAGILDGGVEWYFGDHRLAWSAFLGELGAGPSALAQMLQYDRYFGDHGSVGAFIVDGEEIARVGPLAVVAAPVRGYGLRLRWPVAGVVLELGAEHHEQGSFYSRDALRLGVSREL